MDRSAGLPFRTHHGVGPTLAATGEVLAMGDQALVQLTDEHGDAAHPGVVPEPVAAHADLSAAAPEQHGLIKERPLLNRNIQADRRQRRPGTGRRHKSPLSAYICTSRS